MRSRVVRASILAVSSVGAAILTELVLRSIGWSQRQGLEGLVVTALIGFAASFPWALYTIVRGK
jgi:multisubunit Na+/H+ antiporter MnhF subunit